MADRTAEEIRKDIEQAREQLVVAVDQLSDRTSPKRVVANAKASAVEKAQTPVGMAVLGVAGTLVVVWIVGKIRKN